MEERVDGAHAQKLNVNVFSEKEKLCFISSFIARTDDESDKYGYYVFVVDLSESVQPCLGVLNPNFRLLFDDIGMSVCAIGSTLYFTSFLYRKMYEIDNVYSLDILIPLNQSQKVVGAADFCTLPFMKGKKCKPLITSIPFTNKILVFSSTYTLHRFFDGPRPDGYIHFEIFDVETNSWESLPQFEICVSKNKSNCLYFLHLSHAEEKATTQIPICIGSGDDKCLVYFRENHRYWICGYTLINEGAVFLVKLSCGLSLTLDLNSASRSWKLCDERDIVQVHSRRAQWTYPCGRAHIARLPNSLEAEDDPVKHVYSALTVLDGKEDRVCVVRGAISRHTKRARVALDVVNLLPENLLASYRFEVGENEYKSFIPFFTFVLHSNPK